MLLVKGSLYSKMKWTDAKDMLHGADREICWTDMLLVKGSSYSKKKGTVAKDMLHGADRKICLRRYAISQGLFIFWNEMNGCKRPLYYTERIGKSVWGDMLVVKGSLWVGASFLHGTEREICWIHLLLVKGSLYWGNLFNYTEQNEKSV
jgi:hypothetical protein